MPLFSIIIPTYNRSNLLKKCINSVLKQTFSDWELIVVDNASTDDTEQVVQSFNVNNIRYIYTPIPDRSRARNKGIIEAKGDYILFIDDDDYVLENHLEVFNHQIEKETREKRIYRVGFIQKLNTKEIKSPFYTNEFNPVRFAAFNMCGVWSLCIPHEFLEDNLFPEGFPHWQDTHLILRLFSNYKILQLPFHTYVYVQHENMGSQNVFSSGKAEQRLKLNLAAIDHLFENYGDLVKRFLPPNTHYKLKAEKYLHYAIGDITHGQKRFYKKFLSQSLKTHFSTDFLKYYLVILRGLLFKKRT